MNFHLHSGGAPARITFSEVGAGMRLPDGSMVGGQVAGEFTHGELPGPFTFTVMEGDLPGEAGAAMFATSTGTAGLAVTWERAGDAVAIRLAQPLLTDYLITYALFAGRPVIACHDLFEDDE